MATETTFDHWKVVFSLGKSKNLPWAIFFLLMHVLVPCVRDRENGAQEEEGGGGENGRGGGGEPAQRRRKFWDGSQVPGSNLTHKQVIASFTRWAAVPCSVNTS